MPIPNYKGGWEMWSSVNQEKGRQQQVASPTEGKMDPFGRYNDGKSLKISTS
jgi:hypothetical protein